MLQLEREFLNVIVVFLTGISKSRIICVKAKNLDRIDICSVEKLKSVMAFMQVLSTRYFFLQLAIILRNRAEQVSPDT